MKKIVFALLLLLSFGELLSQEIVMTRHQVQMGETVKMLSRKYRVAPAEIYRLNKFAVDGISQGMVLDIPVEKKRKLEIQEELLRDDPQNTDQQQTASKHTVAPKETLNSISKRYQVPVEKIKNANARKLEKGLQSGMVIVIPSKN